MRTSLFYQDDRQKSELYYISSVTRDRSMTTEEMLQVAGVSMDDFAAKQGWDGWNPEQIISVDYAETEDLESGDLVPEAFFCFETPNGARYIRIPKVSGMWDCVEIVDSRLYEVLNESDWIETVDQRPAYQEYDPEDMTWEYYAVVRGPKFEEMTVTTYSLTYDGLQDALHDAELLYDHMSKYEKEKENVLVQEMREDLLYPSEEVLNWYSLNGVKLCKCGGYPLDVPSRWGVVSVVGDHVLSWGVGDDEKAIFSSYSEALEFLNSCDDIEREDYFVKMVI